ncbi:MAG: oxygenase MpaB family protein [Microbacteriaceae bacterium]
MVRSFRRRARSIRPVRPDSATDDRTALDLSVFGPRVLGLPDIGAEAVLLAAGGRAILLQVANPAVGAGVAEHSDFASRPIDRLRATMTYVYAVVYGTPEQLRIVRRRVNRAHRPVTADAGQDQPGYSAFDPQLQLWVAATLYDSAVAVYQQVFGTLDPESADLIYQDYAALGTALQVPDELWPKDRAAFRDYWDDALRRLEVDEAARRVARDLLFPTAAPAWLRAVMPLGRLLTAGLLPARLRLAYGMNWNDRLQRRFDRWMRVFAATYPQLPARLRHRLRDRLLGDLTPRDTH